MAEKVSRLNFERKDKQKTSVVSDNSHNTLQSKKHSSHSKLLQCYYKQKQNMSF